VLRGWDLFRDAVPPDVSTPVLSLVHDPAPLVAALAARRCTLVHGDLAFVNMAIDDELILLDWQLAGYAPPEFDLLRLIAGCAPQLPGTREELIRELTDRAGPLADPVSQRLAMLAGLVFLGWNKALDVVENPDPAIRDQERADLDW